MNRNSKEKPFPRKCPQCKEPAVRPRVMTYHAEVDYDGRAYEFEVPELRVPKCSKCHTLLLDADANEQISAAFRGFMKLLTPAQIRKNREALGWTQKQLAANLSIAEATVSRWENGGQIQQRSLDKFMRIVFGFPNVRRALLDDEFLSQVGLNPGVTQEPEHAA